MCGLIVPIFGNCQTHLCCSGVTDVRWEKRSQTGGRRVAAANAGGRTADVSLDLEWKELLDDLCGPKSKVKILDTDGPGAASRFHVSNFASAWPKSHGNTPGARSR